MRLRLLVVLLAASIGVRDAARAQAPQFDVTSVKVSRTLDIGGGMRPGPGGSFTAKNVALSGVIELAFGYPPSRIEGLPAWAFTDRFDIAAKPGAAAPASFRELPAMLQSLLAERFGLKTHTVTRDAPIYELRLDRADGRWGRFLSENSNQICRAMADGDDSRPIPALPDRPRCGVTIGPRYLTAVGVRMDRLAIALGRLVDRPVIDRTGLPGLYDVALTFRADPVSDLPLLPGAEPTFGADVASIFPAVRDQLGLKLEPTRGPVEMLVVDAIAQPMPD